MQKLLKRLREDEALQNISVLTVCTIGLGSFFIYAGIIIFKP